MKKKLLSSLALLGMFTAFSQPPEACSLDNLPGIDSFTLGSSRGKVAGENKDPLFYPEEDGFSKELTLLGGLPVWTSKDVKNSALGIGYEVLDHRTAYDFDQTLKFIRNSGVKWARVQTGWQRAETKPGVYDFKWLDHIVDELRAAGIQPWFSLSFGNPLYMKDKTRPPFHTPFYSPTAFGEKATRAWANYCTAMAKHFKNRVFHWELWDEPNAWGFMQKRNSNPPVAEDPEVYVELVSVTEKAIHSVQPEAKIIAGALSGGSICNAYIRRLFQAGIAKHIDIFSYHPYGSIPELYWPERLQFIRNEIAKTGKKIEVWQGENGRPSYWNVTGKGWKYTPGNQAKHLTRRYLTDLRLAVPMTSYFTAGDLGNGYGGKGQVYSQGVVDTSNPKAYKPKLALRAMQSFTRLFDSEAKPVDVNFEVHPYLQDWNWTTRPLADCYGITCGFVRKGVPIYAYYGLSHLDSDYGIRNCSLLFYVDNFQLKEPILIDPLRGLVYRINKLRKIPNECYILERMPLLDYPLFVTDAAYLKK